MDIALDDVVHASTVLRPGAAAKEEAQYWRRLGDRRHLRSQSRHDHTLDTHVDMMLGMCRHLCPADRAEDVQGQEEHDEAEDLSPHEQEEMRSRRGTRRGRR